ncbi:tRNA/rRNA cytosine-C5-methylase [Opitutaceae bacterium TAV1]|nr:tRNA/rRNA cytosine-C5-methylase [Opitutaceae bacterium TAV1]
MSRRMPTTTDKEFPFDVTGAARRRFTLLELIDNIDGALRPGFVFDDWVRGLFSRKELSSHERHLYYAALMMWLRIRNWCRPALELDPDTGLALICLALPPGQVRNALASDLALPESEAGRLPSPDALATVAPDFAPFNLAKLMPSWFTDQALWTFADDTLERWFTPTPMWLRCRPGWRDIARNMMEKERQPTQVHPLLPDALGLPPDTLVSNLRAFMGGLCEVQDIGAQAIIAMSEPQPGEVWLNTFAGLGRHARALADLVGETGRVDAADTRQNELHSLIPGNDPHARKNIRIVDTKGGGAVYDGVFAFALSSCSGLLRHRPWLLHQMSPSTLRDFVGAQHDLLRESAKQVRPGGRLVYAVTSVCLAETNNVVALFAETHPEFEVIKPALADRLARPSGLGWRIHPADLDGDARYMAVFRRRAKPSGVARRKAPRC